MTDILLDRVVAPVAGELAGVDQELTRLLAPEAPELLPFLTHVSKFSGKRLRPAQVFLAGQATGDLTPAHLQVGCIIELIHMATLVHDDVLDGAELRRKLPALHHVSGVEISILLGDYIYAAAFAASTRLVDQACSRKLAATTQVICAGEITQVMKKADAALSVADYYRIIGAKTASLYGAACELGAHYAGAEPDVALRLGEYGFELGKAFQIIDDLLDFRGEEDKVGKTLGSDLTQGKMTLPLIYLRDQAGERGERELSRIFAEVEPAARVEELGRHFDLDRGADFALNKAKELARVALDRLAGLPPTSALDSLQGMAEYVLQRDR